MGAGYGDCSTYFPGGGNYNWCKVDQANGVHAYEVCAGSGVCAASPSSGYAPPSSYAPPASSVPPASGYTPPSSYAPPAPASGYAPPSSYAPPASMLQRELKISTFHRRHEHLLGLLHTFSGNRFPDLMR